MSNRSAAGEGAAARASVARARRLHRVRQMRGVLVQIPFIAVMALILVAAIFLIFDRWRRGTFVLGSAALLTALLRSILPTSRVGLLAVRGRLSDITSMVVLGIAILWLATSIDPLGTD